MKILVTGATSMIGIELCQSLINGGHTVIAVLRKDSIKEKKLIISEQLRCIYLNMEQYADLVNIVTESIDAAVLLAWNGTRGEARNDEEIQVKNYEYNMDAVRALISLGCKKIISAGSQAEYGPWFLNESQTELTETKPNTAYGIQKLNFYSEALKICVKNQVVFIEPRIFSLYGPDDYEGTMVISILRKMLNNETCKLTECKQMWDFLYITDAIEAFIKLLEKECESGVYNLGYGISKPLKNYVEEMYDITQSSSTLQYGAIPYPVTGMVNIHPSVEKMKAIGWSPVVTFKEGIQQILKIREFN